MFKLVKFAFVVGALAAVWALVPVAGRTLHARWSSASGPQAFAKGLWTDLDRALASKPGDDKAKAAAPAKGKAPATRPSEAVTEQDRKALDQIVAERLKH
jgi:hypothetical protein